VELGNCGENQQATKGKREPERGGKQFSKNTMSRRGGVGGEKGGGRRGVLPVSKRWGRGGRGHAKTVLVISVRAAASNGKIDLKKTREKGGLGNLGGEKKWTRQISNGRGRQKGKAKAGNRKSLGLPGRKKMTKKN